MKRHKVIQRNGSLNIPVDIRRESGLFSPGQAVDITLEHGRLVIQHHTPTCLMCGSNEMLIQYRGRNFCEICITAMKTEANKNV